MKQFCVCECYTHAVNGFSICKGGLQEKYHHPLFLSMLFDDQSFNDKFVFVFSLSRSLSFIFLNSWILWIHHQLCFAWKLLWNHNKIIVIEIKSGMKNPEWTSTHTHTQTRRNICMSQMYNLIFIFIMGQLLVIAYY